MHPFENAGLFKVKQHQAVQYIFQTTEVTI